MTRSQGRAKQLSPKNYVKPDLKYKNYKPYESRNTSNLLYHVNRASGHFKTVNGKEYKNAMVRRIEPDGVVLITKVGISKVYFVELPKEVQQRFHYDQIRAAGFNVTVQATVAQSNANAQQEAAAKEKAAKAQLEKVQRESQARQAAEALAPHPVSSMQSVGGGGEQSQIP